MSILVSLNYCNFLVSIKPTGQAVFTNNTEVPKRPPAGFCFHWKHAGQNSSMQSVSLHQQLAVGHRCTMVQGIIRLKIMTEICCSSPTKQQIPLTCWLDVFITLQCKSSSTKTALITANSFKNSVNMPSSSRHN